MIKDLVYELSKYLSDKDILSLSLTNKYYYNIFDEKYWKRKFVNNINYEDINYNLYDERWKFYYLLVSKWLKNKDPISALKFAISEDRSDLLNILFLKYNYDKGKYIYDWYTGKSFSPMMEVLEDDSINCFKFLYNSELYHNYIIVKDAILKHSHKILVLLKNKIIEDHVIMIINQNCKKCAKNVNFQRYANYNFLKKLDYTYINTIFNIPFSILVKYIDIDKDKDKNISNAINKYKNYFN